MEKRETDHFLFSSSSRFRVSDGGVSPFSNTCIVDTPCNALFLDSALLLNLRNTARRRRFEKKLELPASSLSLTSLHAAVDVFLTCRTH